MTNVHRLEDLTGDLAGTHRSTAAEARPVAPDVIETDMKALAADGYVVLPDLITPDACARVRQAIEPWLGPLGRNAFEGQRTQRLYGALNRTREVDLLVEHPRVLALLDRLLMPNYLLSQLQVINILPGESAQLLHPDDGFYPVPRPRAALSAATIWAIDAFTNENGATVLLPGSHTWDDGRQPADTDRRIAAEIPPGSCVFLLGTLWHGGGANRSAAARLAVTAQYCEPWLRTQEAFALSTAREVAREVSEPIRRMLGYSIHPPFVGMVDGMHPKRLLST